MSKKPPSWRCSNWMDGVTCSRPFRDNTATRKRYDVRRFATKAGYEASDLHPSRRKSYHRPISHKAAKATSPSSKKAKVHRLRLRASAKVPTNMLGILSAVPKDWRDKPDPFEKPRNWPDGSLPSFKAMGAIGKGNFGGTVIYEDYTYQKYKNR